jgi:flavin reductase (DIM6/NTAB) family NADH-FMN oxidoreductase RutF
MNTVEGKEIAALLVPTSVTLVTSSSCNGGHCVASVAWAMPLSHEPSIMAIALRPGGKTAKAIIEGGSFCINMLRPQQAQAAIICGQHVEDRFAQAGLTAQSSQFVKAPRIKEALSWVECELIDHKIYGDHELYIGRTKIAQTCADITEEGKVVPTQTLIMSQRGRFGHFQEDK